MKKIISLGIASAVLAMTALSASAALVASTDAAAVNPGATITVTITVDTAVEGVSFDVNATDNLTYVSGTANGGMFSQVAPDGKKVMAAAAFEAGAVVCTLTYTVNGNVGDTVGVALANISGTTGDPVNVSATVVEATSTPDSSAPESSTPDSSAPESSTPDSSAAESTPGGNDNPNSGIALAVFPAIIAGAAVVVAKKRK